jgi:hypothetical protein
MGVTPAEGRTTGTTTAETGSQEKVGIELGVPGWNVIVTLPEATAGQARRILRPWGRLTRTAHFHVLVMSVDNPDGFLREFGAAVAETPGILNFIAHVFPAQRAFDFTTVAEFEEKARETALAWAPVLAGKRFHVRLHRRGLKGVLSTPKEERFLDDALLQALGAAEAPAHIRFDDADFVIHIETLDRRAGMSLWRRDDLERYPFLGVS